MVVNSGRIVVDPVTCFGDSYVLSAAISSLVLQAAALL